MRSLPGRHAAGPALVAVTAGAVTVAVSAMAAGGHSWLVGLPIVGAVGLLLLVRLGVALTGVVVVVVLSGMPGFFQNYLGIRTGVTEVPTVAVLCLTAFAVGRVRLPRAVAISGAVYLAVCTAFLATTLGQGLEYGLRGWVAMVVPPAALVVGHAVVRGDRRPPGRCRASWVIAITITGVAVVNVLLALKQSSLGLTGAEVAAIRANDSTFAVGEQIRLIGAQRSNQDFALLIGCLAPAHLALTLQSRGRRCAVYAAITLGLFAAVFLSLTRTALLATGVASVLVLLTGRGRSLNHRLAWATVFLATLTTAVGVVVLLFPGGRVQASVARVLTLTALTSDTSYQARISDTLPRAWAIFSNNLWGLGPGSAGPVSQRLPGSAPFGVITPDNGYLLIALQVGVVGTAAILVALVVLAVRLCGSTGSPALGRAGGAVVVALLAGMTLAGYWTLLAPMTILAVLVGAASAEGPAAVDRPHPRPTATRMRPAEQRCRRTGRSLVGRPAGGGLEHRAAVHEDQRVAS